MKLTNEEEWISGTHPLALVLTTQHPLLWIAPFFDWQIRADSVLKKGMFPWPVRRLYHSPRLCLITPFRKSSQSPPPAFLPLCEVRGKEIDGKPLPITNRSIRRKAHCLLFTRTFSPPPREDTGVPPFFFPQTLRKKKNLTFIQSIQMTTETDRSPVAPLPSHYIMLVVMIVDHHDHHPLLEGSNATRCYVRQCMWFDFPPRIEIGCGKLRIEQSITGRKAG